MPGFSKRNDNFQYDTLSVEIKVDVKKVYKNISKVKGRMVSVIDWKLFLYINGNKLAEDEILVIDEFFDSLLRPGKYPLFTCTCGIFGCGGYYVEVIHDTHSITWITEQSPFEDQLISTSKEFVFSRNHIVEVAEELRQKLNELQDIMNNTK
ncbi:hypothetical protein [Paenibacillus dauci]|uniref:hypothetical protein n=1 Tax=Paenibacillus dauci TaxID=1567106 RepID=UPI000696150F|nr:hypothetical protein [Paenibacillus dauci]